MSWVGRMTVGAASVVALLLAITWPFPPSWKTDPEPLAADQKLAAYQRSLGGRWQQVTEQYPDAERPDVAFVAEMTPTNWDDTMGACLRAAGFEVSGDGTSGFSIGTLPGMDLERAQIDQYSCDAEYPYQGLLDSLMSVDERGALYDFYTRSLAPCLELHGMTTPDAPARRDFVAQSGSAGDWLPYDWNWLGGYDEERWSALDRDCPSTPPWRETGLFG